VGEPLQENNVEIPRGLGLEHLGHLRRKIFDIIVTERGGWVERIFLILKNQKWEQILVWADVLIWMLKLRCLISKMFIFWNLRWSPFFDF
jgi:hypothetical protein